MAGNVRFGKYATRALTAAAATGMTGDNTASAARKRPAPKTSAAPPPPQHAQHAAKWAKREHSGLGEQPPGPVTSARTEPTQKAAQPIVYTFMPNTILHLLPPRHNSKREGSAIDALETLIKEKYPTGPQPCPWEWAFGPCKRAMASNCRRCETQAGLREWERPRPDAAIINRVYNACSTAVQDSSTWASCRSPNRRAAPRARQRGPGEADSHARRRHARRQRRHAQPRCPRLTHVESLASESQWRAHKPRTLTGQPPNGASQR